MSIDDDTITETAIESRNLLSIVANLHFFSGLEPDLLQKLAETMEWFSLPGGTTLFEAGDAADSVYVVIAGCLAAYLPGTDDRPQFVGRITAGESVGEMAVIADKPRSATVIALRDSEIGRWSKRAFQELMMSHPEGMLRVAQLTVQRLEVAQKVQSAQCRGALRTFAVVPHDVEVDAVGFASELVRALNMIGRTELIWNVRGAEHTTHWFNNVERANDYVVYVTDHKPTHWSKLCLRQADALLLLARADTTPVEWSVLERMPQAHIFRHRSELVLLHDNAIVSGAAARWTQVRPECFLHHARSFSDIERIARLLTGRAIGLTLSGGGARGFAHIGVIRAMREANIPIDAVGGTSIGAIIAGGVACEWNHEELCDHVKRTFVDTNPLSDYTFPFVSLVSGRKVSRLLRQEMGNVQIEDLPVPYFCVSTNLTTGKSAIHRSGELWRWLRASVAIPGVLPPVFSNGEVFVDGATINNLPVDVMRDFCRGIVIGVEVGAERTFTTDMEEAEGPPLWSLVKRWRGRKKTINIFQILSRAGMINSASNTAAMREDSDLLLQPPLQEIDLLNWQAFDKAVEHGYRYASQRLSSLRIQDLCK